MDDPYLTLPPQPIARDRIAAELPQRIGRYRIERILGEGGFGLVYLAHDEQLNRHVAIKVPHPHLVARAGDAETYLTEARTVASLDHPNIVPVHDVGRTDEHPCFVVSKFIEGSTLAQRIKTNRPTVAEAAELVLTVAETLHYAHRRGLVHRDIKPGNILLDISGKPYVADFGLALRDTDIMRGPHYAGTPAYMSPEQARGEGHRVDGRSDLFSLGVVFYELLTGRRPFKAETVDDLLEQVRVVEVRPPRQWDDTIPRELERICLKSLSKRASERYSTGKDMADDLRHFFEQATEDEKRSLRSSVPAAGSPSPAAAATPVPSPLPTPRSDSRLVRIVPKGLRSFDAQDADFFLELLPGPRDRDGLPDSIRFWKGRIEEADPDSTFAVGLIYGPSGCGKSSLVKAGLLPRLSGHVVALYVESTADDTETRLLSGLRKRCPGLPEQLGLKETLAALRRGQGITADQKVLLVLDQFEQWLHARKDEENTELVQALRQCDGSRVQCIVLVRDDFWLAVSRFVRDLEVDLVPGRNIALVDLFDLDHGRKLLAALGRAFGKLPEQSREMSKEQHEFLSLALSGLAQENKVICVRLALFAEMMKGRPWTPATLRAVGGAAGVGVTFLEDTFSAPTSNPRHRLHQKAARAVLKALLPESGTDIKGTMRSHAELLAASGYANRPREFADLMCILDGEIRLLTPTDPEGKEGAEGPASRVQAGEKYYQLTHDYLVPSLREWLTRKQKETRRGRAELLLADRAAIWNAHREDRQLPSLLQWMQIRLLTRKKSWTPPERKMMRRATRCQIVRGLVLALLLTLIGWGAYETHGSLRAHALVNSLLRAETTKVPDIVRDMAPYRRWLNPLLVAANQDAETKQDARKHLHTSLALLPVDAGQVEHLHRRLLDAEPQEVVVLRDALVPHQDRLVDRLWDIVEQPARGEESQRLRAASALAAFDPQSERWIKARTQVAGDLVAVPAVHLPVWKDALRPVQDQLLAPLSVIFRDSARGEIERSLAAELLADYAREQPKVLADLLMDADEKQFARLYPILKDHGEQAIIVLQAEMNKPLPPDATEDAREKQARRQANGALALLRLAGAEQVWSLLRHSPDPRARSYFIHRLGPLGVDPAAVIRRLGEEQDVSIRRALLLILGEFTGDQLSATDRELLLPKVLQLYRDDTDPGLHAAAEWLLRTWKHDKWLRQTNEKWAADVPLRDRRLDSIKKTIQNGKERAPLQWYVNGQGQTMIVVPGPVTFPMGSPATEEGRQVGEVYHKQRIGRSFALASKTVTQEEYNKYDSKHAMTSDAPPTADLPVVNVDWYAAAAYCNWLSEQEGIAKDQRCYEMDPKGRITKLKDNYLSLTGYRLPTEAEMECATRAGTKTSRYYGETEDLLMHYAWYSKNSQDRRWPVGMRKPNDFGFFDLHGNVAIWCQERYRDYPAPKGDEALEDREDTQALDSTTGRALRGGGFSDRPRFVRSADRYGVIPTNKDNNIGLRVARTIAP